MYADAHIDHALFFLLELNGLLSWRSICATASRICTRMQVDLQLMECLGAMMHAHMRRISAQVQGRSALASLDQHSTCCSQADPYFTQSEKPPPLLSIQLFHVPQLEGGDKHEVLKKAEAQEFPKKFPVKHAKRWLARTRNRLLSVALGEESGILWLDPDLVSLPADMVPAILRSEKDIAVPVVR